MPDFTISSEKLDSLTSSYNVASNISEKRQAQFQMFRQVAELQESVRQGNQLNDEQTEFMRQNEQRAYYDFHNEERALKYAQQMRSGRDISFGRAQHRDFGIER